ncbi:MAG: glycosyltransferase [Elusimicrobia bacterium]|nr:glycosyltransferase [Elusimicrobiota bacterium]
MASAARPDIRLNIVGDGSELADLKEIAERESIRGIVFWGRRPQSDMPAFFRASDVMVISLLDDPIFALTVPAKFQAYLAFSKPIFAVIKGDVRDMVESRGLGLYAPPESPEAIRDGFLRFRETPPAALKDFSRNAGELLRTVYAREKVVAGMTELLRDAAEKS